MWKFILGGVLSGILLLYPFLMFITHIVFEPRSGHHHTVSDILFIELTRAFSLTDMFWILALGLVGGILGFLWFKKRELFIVLQNNNEQYRRLIINIPGMIYKGNPDWSTEISENCEKLCGYQAHDLMTEENIWAKIIHPDDKQRVFSESSKIVEESLTLVQEYRIITKDGKIKWVRDHKNSSFEDDGSFNGVDGIVYDITDHKMVEEQRDKLLLETLSDLKKLGRLLPICSHCKKIRDDKGYWNQIEAYITDHSDTVFSHGICQECAEKYYPDMDLYGDDDG